MAQHWNDLIGKARLASWIYGSWEGSIMQLLLWKNNITVDHTTLYADLVEATFPGYARIPTGVSPSLDGLDADFNYVLGFPDPYIWTMTSSSPTNVIYGYSIWDDDAGDIILSERFTDPVAMDHSGATLTLNLALFANNNPAP